MVSWMVFGHFPALFFSKNAFMLRRATSGTMAKRAEGQSGLLCSRFVKTIEIILRKLKCKYLSSEKRQWPEFTDAPLKAG